VWLATDPLTMAARLVEETKQQAAVAAAANDPFKEGLDPKTNKFSYEVLKSSFPPGVVPTKKEYYLSDEEFTRVLGMTHAQWDALKQWKRDQKKKEVGLF